MYADALLFLLLSINKQNYYLAYFLLSKLVPTLCLMLGKNVF